MNEVLTARDMKAVSFVNNMGMASLTQLAEAVYGGSKSCESIARRRLRLLAERRMLSRVRYGQNTQFVYYTGKRPPMQPEHTLLLVDVHNALLRLGGQIEKFDREPQWDGLRPDAYCVYWYNGRRYHFCIEIERGYNPFNQSKYESFFTAQTMFNKSFPMVFVVSAKPVQIQPSKIRYVVCKPDMRDIMVVLNRKDG
jgi:hypothetical protein